MSTPYIGEIRLFGGNFAPAGWAFCDGSLLPISENDALFVLIGTTYGGDGQSTFALPDLRGRTPVHQAPTYVMGQKGGAESVTLTTQQLPAHTHTALGTGGGNAISPGGAYWSTDPGGNTAAYSSANPDSAMSAAAVGTTGGSTPHDNMSPFLVVNYIIALFGVFPSQD